MPEPGTLGAAVVGGDWINDEDLPRPPRLVAWAERETPGWSLFTAGRLIAGALAAVAVLTVMVWVV